MQKVRGGRENMGQCLRFATNYILFTLGVFTMMALIPILLVLPFCSSKLRKEFLDEFWWEDDKNGDSAL
jgi:hypothetical protein